MSIREIVKNIYNTSTPASARNLIRKYKSDVLAEFNNKYSFKLCINMIMSDVYTPPLCSCGAECVHDDNQWKQTCGSSECYTTLKRRITLSSADKIKATNLDRYGVESFTQSSTFKEKTSSTNMERYGTSTYVTSEDFKLKSLTSSLANNGTPHPMQSDRHRMKPRNTKKQQFENLNPELSERNLASICNASTSITDVCKAIYMSDAVDYDTYNRVASVIRRLGLPYNAKDHRSNGEDEVLEYIRSLYSGDIVTNGRKILPSGRELDIYLPDLNLAIEYNGEYWLSENVHKNKHNLLEKTLECEQCGIHLLHVYDSEWKDPSKQDIWKSMICHKMGLTKNKIYARACKVSLDHDPLFFDLHHIQGYAKGSILTVSLKHGDMVVAQMSISKSRFNKNYEFEILRFAVMKHTHIVGGFAKLFKFAKLHLNSNSFISYANRRWSQGNVYTSSGEFVFIGASRPNYIYHKQGKTVSRINAQKHKLPKLLESFDPSKSETQNMRDAGYVIVYDCGNLAFSSK